MMISFKELMREIVWSDQSLRVSSLLHVVLGNDIIRDVTHKQKKNNAARMVRIP